MLLQVNLVHTPFIHPLHHKSAIGDVFSFFTSACAKLNYTRRTIGWLDCTYQHLLCQAAASKEFTNKDMQYWRTLVHVHLYLPTQGLQGLFYLFYQLTVADMLTENLLSRKCFSNNEQQGDIEYWLYSLDIWCMYLSIHKSWLLLVKAKLYNSPSFCKKLLVSLALLPLHAKTQPGLQYHLCSRHTYILRIVQLLSSVAEQWWLKPETLNLILVTGGSSLPLFTSRHWYTAVLSWERMCNVRRTQQPLYTVCSRKQAVTCVILSVGLLGLHSDSKSATLIKSLYLVCVV